MEVRLVVERGAGSGHTFRMRSPEMLIGRKKGCGLRIPSAAVSREHCRLQLIEGFLTIEDLGSVNGTWVNGEPVSERQPVRPGDRLKVGPVLFVVEYELDAAALDRLFAWEEARRAAAPAELDFLGVEEPVPLSLGPDEDDPDVALKMTDSDSDFALPVEEEEPHPSMFQFDNDIPLELPSEGQLRDFLEQLDEAADED
jgi:hypothetical protein